MAEHLNELRTELQDAVDFACVYILEAHAADEWPIGSRVNLKQTTTTEARLQAANSCVRDTNLNWPMYIDKAPENTFQNAYLPWPIRFYLFSRVRGEVKVVYIAEPDEASYSLDVLKVKALRAAGRPELSIGSA